MNYFALAATLTRAQAAIVLSKTEPAPFQFLGGQDEAQQLRAEDRGNEASYNEFMREITSPL